MNFICDVKTEYYKNVSQSRSTTKPKTFSVINLFTLVIKEIVIDQIFRKMLLFIFH